MTDAKVPVTDAILASLATRHGIVAPWLVPRPWVGATSCVYPLVEVVVKIPHAEPAAIAALRTDVAVSPILMNMGVRVARLVAFDDSVNLLPVPYAIFERIPGTSLDETGSASNKAVLSWEAVGRQLALVHAIDGAEATLSTLRRFSQTAEVDPRPRVTELTRTGVLDSDEAGLWSALLERLVASALEPIPLRLCHGDLNAANILVHSVDPSTVTLIDWAGAGWLDPVWDFVGVPLGAVPHLLRGHRTIGPLPRDETAEARILWCRLQVALNSAQRATTSQANTGQFLSRVLKASMRFAASNEIR